MKTKIIAVMLAMVFMFGLTACGTEIADTNGPDDQSLATITDQNIIDLDLGASGYSMSPGSEDDDFMYEMTKFKGKEFSGATELWGTNYLGKSDVEVKLTNIQVTSGNFKLVAVLDDEIVHVFDNDEMNQMFRMDDINGYFSIRMAGETADFKIYMQVW
jgi:hypothetical protein